MKRLMGWVVGVVVAGMMWASGPAGGEEFALTAVEPGTDEPCIQHMWGEYRPWQDLKPKGLKKVPEDFGKGARYSEREIGDGQCIMALVGDKLYIDTNMNGDMTDEKAVTISQAKDKKRGLAEDKPRNLGMIRVNPGEGRPEVRIWPVWYPSGTLLVKAAGLMRGEMRLGDEEHEVTLLDANKNGKFEGWGGKDMIAVKPKGEKEETGATVKGSGLMPTPKMLRNGKGEYYEIAVKEDGTGIRVERAHPKMGFLRVKSAEGEVTVSSECGEETLAIPQEKQALAAGQYRLQGIKLREKDAKGHEWKISGYWGEKRTIDISEGKETEVILGPPFTPTTQATRLEKGAVFIMMEMKGVDAATYYYEARASKDGKQEPAPKLKVVAKSGLTLLRASLEGG